VNQPLIGIVREVLGADVYASDLADFVVIEVDGDRSSANALMLQCILSRKFSEKQGYHVICNHSSETCVMVLPKL
jgi:hypothetical protein